MSGRTLVSCVGDVSVTRACGYCKRCRRGVVEVDAWAGLERDSLTPRGRRMAVLAGSRMSFDDASDHLDELCGIRISDQTIRRACHKAGRRAKAYLEQTDNAADPVREAEGQRECSTDGVKVNTVNGWREMRALTASKRPPGESRGIRHWRKRDLPKPEATLCWAGIADHEQVGERMASMRNRLNWRRGRDVSVVADGAPWIWRQAREHLPDHEGCVDLWHVMEHFHAAGRVVHDQPAGDTSGGDSGGDSGGEEARRWAERQRALLFRHGAIRYLQDHLRPQLQDARQAGDRDHVAHALRSLLMYLFKHRGRLNYRDRLRRGLPIGSGQIEGVCKNTLHRRLRKNSPRWRPENADRIAALCCLHTSDRWDNFWKQAA